MSEKLLETFEIINEVRKWETDTWKLLQKQCEVKE